jgi:Flp pilus assembly pilin Flp
MDRISWFFLELLMRPRRDESGALSLEWAVIAAALLAAAIFIADKVYTAVQSHASNIH